ALGILYERLLWNWAKAGGEFRRARELDPTDDRASLRLAMMGRAAIGRLDAAIAAIRPVVARDPLNTAALAALGRVQHAAGFHRESAATYQELLTLNPDYHGARSALALALIALGSVDEAHRCAAKEADD